MIDSQFSSKACLVYGSMVLPDSLCSGPRPGTRLTKKQKKGIVDFVSFLLQSQFSLFEL
jgi:hypothetical protein